MTNIGSNCGEALNIKISTILRKSMLKVQTLIEQLKARSPTYWDCYKNCLLLNFQLRNEIFLCLLIRNKWAIFFLNMMILKAYLVLKISIIELCPFTWRNKQLFRYHPIIPIVPLLMMKEIFSWSFKITIVQTLKNGLLKIWIRNNINLL